MNYERINWENAPSTDTPLDADNLNKMDEALDTLNREVAKTRSDVQEVEETAASLGSQISGIIRLEDGSTTGDAELINGRVGKDGTTYDTIGNAIRGQIGDLRNHVIEVSDEEPEEFYNKIWVKDDDEEIEIPTKAELDAVNERLGDAVAYRTIDNTVTDLNNVTKSGFYQLPFSGTYDNCPIATNNFRTLLVFKAVAQITQIIVTPFNIGDFFIRFFSGSKWGEWVRIKADDTNFVALRSWDNTVTDLNNVTKSGFYQLPFSGTYDNCPIATNNFRTLLVFKAEAQITQIIVTPFNIGDFFIRFFSGSKWGEWVRIKVDDTNFVALRSWDNTVTDLNNVTKSGFYLLPFSGTYDNCPIATSTRRWLIVYYTGGNAMQIIVNGLTGEMFERVMFGGSTWGEWVQIGLDTISANNMLGIDVESFSSSETREQGINSGDVLTVVSYNLANYNNDSTTYIQNDKLLNLKKCLMNIDADIVGTQEDRLYIDRDNTKPSRSYIYFPNYPRTNGTEGCVIHSKLTQSNTGVGAFSNGREVRFSTIDINGKTLLIVSTHPVSNYSGGADSIESINARKTQYNELFGWLQGNNTLYFNGEPVTCPNYTHCIICIDSNALTSDDKTNLTQYAHNAGYKMANGDPVGWFYTAYAGAVKYSIDNIICSSNIIINNVNALNSWYKLLYSDHVPVIANVTLT